MSLYRDEIVKQMNRLAEDKRVMFVGYNVKCGRAGGTLVGVPEDRLVETPVAENLMVGVAMGLALSGFLPVVYFERFDFVLNAVDAIVNHLDKLPVISDDKFAPKVILRIVAGNRKKPLFTGLTHTGNYSKGLSKMVSFAVMELRNEEDVSREYESVIQNPRTIALVEFKDLY